MSGRGLFVRWDCCTGVMAFVLFMHELWDDDPIDHSSCVTSVSHLSLSSCQLLIDLRMLFLVLGVMSFDVASILAT